MKSVFIIHGWGADSSSNWFPWLAEELRKEKYKASTPDFPNTQNPKLVEWLKHFKIVTAGLVPVGQSRRPQRSQLQDTILVGHSLGCPFILRYLESLKDEKVKAVFLVSAFDRELGISEIKNFVDKPFDWEKIKNVCQQFYVINSDNDPYIPFVIAREVAKNLDIELIVEHNGQHLNAPGGYLKYKRLLDLIVSVK